MSGALLHFERGVPIDDLNIRQDQKNRLARVQHVYWQWVRNPFSVDYKLFLRQLVRGKFADAPSETRVAQKDIMLFEFIKESITPMSRKEAQMKVTEDYSKKMGKKLNIYYKEKEELFTFKEARNSLSHLTILSFEEIQKLMETSFVKNRAKI